MIRMTCLRDSIRLRFGATEMDTMFTTMTTEKINPKRFVVLVNFGKEGILYAGIC